MTADKTPNIFHIHFHLIPGMCLGLYVEAHFTQSSETAKQNQIKLVWQIIGERWKLCPNHWLQEQKQKLSQSFSILPRQELFTF